MLSVEDYLGVPGDPVLLQVSGPRNKALAVRLTELASWLTLDEQPGEAELLAPRGTAEHGPLEWFGAVEGRMRESVVELLRALATGRPQYDGPATLPLTRETPGPRHLTLYVTASCPFCPGTTAAAGRLVLAHRDWSLRVRRIDETSGAPDNVLSAPTLRWSAHSVSGALSETRVVELLAAD